MAKIITNGPTGHGTRIILEDGSELHGVESVTFRANCEDINRIEATLAICECEADGELALYRGGRRIAKIVYMDGGEEVFGEVASVNAFEKLVGYAFSASKAAPDDPYTWFAVGDPTPRHSRGRSIADYSSTETEVDDYGNVKRTIYPGRPATWPMDAEWDASPDPILAAEERPLSTEDAPDRAFLKRQREQIAKAEAEAKEAEARKPEAEDEGWKPNLG